MTPQLRGLLLAAAHVALLLSMGAKLRFDRASLPRVWARAEELYPSGLVPGRYANLTILVEPRDLPAGAQQALLRVEGGRLIAAAPGSGDGLPARLRQGYSSPDAVALADRVPFYIPRYARLGPGPRHELWVDLTVPKTGSPRPIRLAVMKEGKLTPLGW